MAVVILFFCPQMNIFCLFVLLLQNKCLSLQYKSTTNLIISKMKTLNDYTNEIMATAKAKADIASQDYNKAVDDCKQGIYDKWYRYHRADDGYAYDLGWMNQNQETQNDVVRFING